MQGVRDAASVIVLEPGSPPRDEPRVLLVKRQRKASFMASAWVFPGGAVDAGERDPRHAAVRELFEETGILLAAGDGARGELDALRRRALDGDDFAALLAEQGLAPALDALHYFAHWITPSIETKRFSAQFFVAAHPAEQRADTGAGELDEARWFAPSEALERARELRLPPPQLHILFELRELARRGGTHEILASCGRRAARPHAILPRAAPHGDGFALLLPWDPDYESLGRGDALPMPPDHPLAEGPSRFILENTTWKHAHAPR